MADSFIQVPVDGIGKKVDAASLDVGTNSVIRQRIVLGDNSATAQFATVTGGALNVNVATGTVAISGTAIVAFSIPQVVNNISATVNTVVGAGTANIGGVSLVAGTANIGFINNISATVTVQGNINISATASVIIGAGTQNIGAVSLGAGAANIGFINSISAPVQLAAGAANIGYINDISATLDVLLAQGSSNIGGVSLVAGTSNIGFINHISATVNIALAGTMPVSIAGTVGISATTTLPVSIASNLGINAISATVVTGLSYVIEKTTNSQVQVGDSANAAIRVNIVAGAVGGSGGTSQMDGTSFDTQVAFFTPSGGIFDDAGSNTLSENDAGIVRMTTNRAFHVNMRTDGGAKMEDSANTALRVNVVAGSAGGPSIIDNTTYSTGATSIAPIGFIHFSASSTTMTEGRVGAARITAERGLHINLRNNAGTEIGTNTTPLSVKVENQSATVVVGFATPPTINNISATVNTVIGAGTSNIGFINNISATVSVVIAAGTANIGGVSLVAGTANIGFINNISATVNVAFAGGISLAAGTANIGFINNISATVNTVIGAGTQNIGFINAISATVTVAGIVNISNTPSVVVAAFKDNSGNTIQIVDSSNIALRVMGFGTLGSLPIGGFLDSGGANRFVVDSANLSLRVTIAAASATVTVVTANPWLVNIPSVSHGPKVVWVSTSATATLIAAPGAGFHIYVTSVAVSNAGTVNTDVMVGWSGSIQTIAMFAAANGGGFVMNIDPPWKVQSNEAVICRIATNSIGNVFFNVNFFVST